MPLITAGKGWSKAKIEAFDEVKNLNDEGKVKEALELLFPELKEPYLTDFTKVAFFLMNPGNLCCNDKIQTEAKSCQQALNTERGNSKVSISRLLRRMMRKFEFSDVPGVYMVGDAGDAFARVVRNKILFVDGISWVHGEFTHTIQWLYVCYAKEGGEIVTTEKVADLYSKSVDYLSPYTFKAEQGGKAIERNATVWDFCVDCFLPLGVSFEPNLVENRFSRSGRSPAWVQKELLSGSLQDTVFGKILGNRYKRLTINGQSMEEYLPTHKDELNQFYINRAKAKMATKPRVFVPGTKTLVPDPTGGNMNSTTGKLSNRDSILSTPTGKLFKEGELATMELNAQKFAQGKYTGNDEDLDGLWLKVKIPK